VYFEGVSAVLKHRVGRVEPLPRTAVVFGFVVALSGQSQTHVTSRRMLSFEITSRRFMRETTVYRNRFLPKSNIGGFAPPVLLNIYAVITRHLWRFFRTIY
jgi:hypothetical protein